MCCGAAAAAGGLEQQSKLTGLVCYHGYVMGVKEQAVEVETTGREC